MQVDLTNAAGYKVGAKSVESLDVSGRVTPNSDSGLSDSPVSATLSDRDSPQDPELAALTAMQSATLSDHDSPQDPEFAALTAMQKMLPGIIIGNSSCTTIEDIRNKKDWF